MSYEKYYVEEDIIKDGHEFYIRIILQVILTVAPMLLVLFSRLGHARCSPPECP